MTTAKIKEELYEAVDFRPATGEKQQEVLKRLVEALDELDDKQFGNLSKEARQWADTATKAVLAKATIPGFPADEPEDDFEEAAPEEAEKEPMPHKAKANGVKRVKRAVEKEEKPQRTPRATLPKAAVKATADERLIKPRSHLPTGRKKHVHDCLVKNPNASVDEIIDYLERKGQEVPTRITIATFRSGFRSVVQSLARHKKLSEPMELSPKRHRRTQRQRL